MAFLVIVLLLLCSGAVSASEIAYFSLGAAEMNELNTKKSASHALVLHLLSRPKRLLATILIGNNFLNVGIVVLSTYITGSLADFSSHPLLSFLIQVVVVTSLILLVAEIMPKVYATRQTLRIAIIMSGPPGFPGESFLSPKQLAGEIDQLHRQTDGEAEIHPHDG